MDMKLGATFSNAEMGNDFALIKDAVQALEGAGFDSIASNDHVLGGHPERAGGEVIHTSKVGVHEPIVLLSFIGAVTSRLELVTSILILPQRQTALVAKQAAELDLLSGGRLRLGVGVGRNWMEYEALNEPFTNRGRRIEEQVEVLRRLWTEDHVTFAGRWHQLDRIGLNPLPVQRPIPIWMGSFVGTVVDKVIERIGRLADGWICQMPANDELTAVVERLHGYAAAAGRVPASLGVECGIRAAQNDDPQRWADLAVAYRDRGATHLRVLTSGDGNTTPSERVDTMLRWRDVVAAALV